MKKIGFIDYYLDEWHAENYPTMIRESSFRDQFDVVLAWEETTPEGKIGIDEWCRQQRVEKASSIQEVVDECDFIIVLSPDNAERHEDLADLPLRSGKPVYIDKPIAPSLAAAQRIYEKARQHGTPLMSCSALRFGSELEQARKTIGSKPVHYVATRGMGRYETYAIHQLEMLVMLAGTGAVRARQSGNSAVASITYDYPDDRRSSFTQIPEHPIQISAAYGDGECVVIDAMDDFFPRFIEAMLSFFATGESAAPQAETLEIAALIEAGAAALRAPDTWVDVPKRL